MHGDPGVGRVGGVALRVRCWLVSLAWDGTAETSGGRVRWVEWVELRAERFVFGLQRCSDRRRRRGSHGRDQGVRRECVRWIVVDGSALAGILDMPHFDRCGKFAWPCIIQAYLGHSYPALKSQNGIMRSIPVCGVDCVCRYKMRGRIAGSRLTIDNAAASNPSS
jgi:hypothetical protein